MVDRDAHAGHHTRWYYLWEDNEFKESPSDSTNKTFGKDVEVGTLEGSHNAVRTFNPNSREAAEVIEQNFDGSFSVSFTMTSHEWLRAVISTGSGSSPITYDGKLPDSMRIFQARVGRDDQSDVERRLLGCVVNTCTIETSWGNLATVTLDGAYAEEEKSPNATLDSQPTNSDRPLHFGDTTVTRAGSTLNLVQDVTVTIENNIDLIGELGDIHPVDYSPKERTMNVEYGRIVQNDDDLERFYGSGDSMSDTVTNTEDIEVEFKRSSSDLIRLIAENAFPNQHSRSGVGQNTEDLEDALTEMAPTLKAEVQEP